jgi:uncharacterized iron-regulated membrane protein
MATDTSRAEDRPSRAWPDYRAVWRWHFYAALFCLPFFCWLAVTGSIYLFRPDIEALLDRPYESLSIAGPRAAPSAEARAAVAAVPGSIFSHYEPPATATGAAQVVVAEGGHLFRVYVHPGTLRPMSVSRDDHRPMDVIAHLHGQLMLGDTGGTIVEVAGSWGIVMILTGFYLWFPRGAWRLGGLVYPRMGLRGRLFWRDLHAVTGVWISVVTLFLLLSGLPWSANWGRYFTWVRNHWSVTAGTPDWPIGARDEPAPHIATKAKPAPISTMPGMSTAEMAAMAPGATETELAGRRPAPDLRALDTILPTALRLHLPRPIWISPPAPGMRDWTAASRAQNRPQRTTYAIAPETGAVSGRTGFAEENVVDRAVNVAVAAHEGQLFGRLNQAILLVNAMGVLLVTTSAVVMWWRRRPSGVLGTPPVGARPRFSALLLVVAGVLSVIVPLFGASLAPIIFTDRVFLSRVEAARRWLGLRPLAS